MATTLKKLEIDQFVSVLSGEINTIQTKSSHDSLSKISYNQVEDDLQESDEEFI